MDEPTDQSEELQQLAGELTEKLSKVRTFLVELYNSHEARGKIQSGWKYNSKEIIDLIDA